MTRAALVLSVILFAHPVVAETQPLAWGKGRVVASHISDGLVGLNLGLDAWRAFRPDPDRVPRAWRFACRTGLTFGAAELTKRLVERERPDGSDRKSFYSMHTAATSLA